MNKMVFFSISLLMCLTQFANAGSRDRYDRRPGKYSDISSSSVCKVVGSGGSSYVTFARFETLSLRE